MKNIYLQNYLLNIFESMPSGIIAVDSHGKITLWNRTAEKYADAPNSLKKGGEIWKTVPNLGIYKDELLKLVDRSGGHIEICREPFINGEKRNLNIHLFPLTASGVKGSIIFINDITELKKKEEQLIQDQKIEIIGTLTGGIAHDFNNILSGIVGVVSILKYEIDRNSEISKDHLSEYLDIMEQYGQKAGVIVQRLLTLSKKQNTVFENVEVAEVLKYIIKICSNTFDKSVKIVVINPTSKSSVYADFTQLEQVILNLAINANHAMTIMRPDVKQWGGMLEIGIHDFVKSEELSRFINSDDKNNYFKISIKDTGIGMDSSTVKQIFQPFFSMKDKSIGIGLGLTIVYNIVKQFGGFIDIESTPDVGTEFKLYFPKFDKNMISER
ncbi:MAG: PAS domain S-box protein [Candidatus Delongbacteria bacterium]|nr:PAS domain S-box protein [Candidatus Delongbacteria bacterium]MCG2759871.1 ATP-binding protein [Candidatus Delongbacteria bacterium]